MHPSTHLSRLSLRLQSALLERQTAEGGWGSSRQCAQPALEPTCLSALALRSDPGSVLARGSAFLLRHQRRDGSWPAVVGDEGGSGLTALAVLTLNNLGLDRSASQLALNWLLESRGRESHWLWRWKFWTSDRHVRFDPGKYGWPWMPGTCSWVIPTAFSLLALRQSFPCCRPDPVKTRIAIGIQMLLDRACPGGGWNAGNGVVYGVAMAAHIDTTAVALLALRSVGAHEFIMRSVGWLEGQACHVSAPWSLAWSILALHAYDRPISDLADHLAALCESDQELDTETVAAAVLALDCSHGQNPFKVIT